MTPPSSTTDRPTLPGTSALAVLLDDQSLAWRTGRGATVETYLERYPALRDNREAVLDLIYHEVLLRSGQGESPTLAEYVERFPELAEQLRDQFAVHQVLTPEGAAAMCRDVGPRVPGYEIQEELGRGGMGVVYRARQLSLNRPVALKVLHPGARAASTQEVARLRSEAEAVARLQHPHIVQIFEVGTHAESPFLALEYVAGGSLDKRLRGTPLPAPRAAQLLETLAQAVHYAHQQGVIHRDLKPANILLTPGESAADLGIAKVADFGLAKQLDAEVLQSRSGNLVGTPSYMAPEQARGQSSQVGPATDVYALGAILYETLTGRPPFKAETLWDTLEQVVTQEPVAPRQLQPRVPRDLDTICLKCLHKDPGRRYATALELAEDLQRFLAGQPIRARQAPAWELAWKWSRRHRTISAVGLSSLVLVLLLSGLHYLHLRQALDAALVGQERQAAAVEAQTHLFKAESAAAAQRWAEAETELAALAARLGPALARSGDDAQLVDLQTRGDRLRRQVAVRLTDLEGLRQLRSSRSLAGFHAAGFTGLDEADNLRRLRAVVAKGLRPFHLAPADGENLNLTATSYAAAEQIEVREGCLEMLVSLADLLAEQAARQTQTQARSTLAEALRIAEHAAMLDPTAHAPARLRARLLNQAGGAMDLPAQSRPFEHYLAGNEDYRAGRLPEALAHYQQAVGQAADHYGALYALAVCHLKLREQRPDAARTHLALAVARLSRCIDNEPQHSWPYLLRGFAYGELDDFVAAEADFTRVEQANARQVDEAAQYGVHVNRGVMRIRRGDSAGAVADLEKATRLKPKEYAALVNLAQAYQQQLRFPEALVCLDSAVALQPPLVIAALYRNRARLHEQRQDLAAALADLAAASRTDPLGPKSAAVAGDHFERGRLLAQQQEHARALAAFDAALAIRPNHPQTHRFRAEALLRLGRHVEAVESLGKFFATDLERRRPSAAAYLARAQAQADLGKHIEAAEDYTRGLELTPDDTTARAGRAWIYLVLDAPQLALVDFEKLLTAAPENPDALLGRGYAWARLGKYRAGIKDAEAALRRTPTNPRNIYNAARVYAQALAPAEQDPELQTPQGREVRIQYHDRCLALLRQAVQALPSEKRASFWWTTVQNDPALAAIRRSAAFRALAESFPKPSRPE